MSKAILKWCGGKQFLLPELLKRVPKEFEIYWEPFFGGGSLFFALKPQNAFLSDINYKLINFYVILKDSLPDLIKDLQTHEYTKQYYYNARKEFNHPGIPLLREASLFLYFNKTCFNGLYRENQKGEFNTPMGAYKNPNWCDMQALAFASQALQPAYLDICSFEEMLPYINSGDFYYLDPPYYKTYDKYSKEGFSEAKHRELFDFCVAVHEKGSKFMLSNSNTEFVRNLYDEFNIEEIQNSRSISSKKSNRGKETELLIRNYG